MCTLRGRFIILIISNDQSALRPRGSMKQCDRAGLDYPSLSEQRSMKGAKDHASYQK